MNPNLLPAVANPAFGRLKAVLDRLGAAPPQVLLLEGGSEEQRLDLARYWAARCNCPQAASREDGAPCLACPVCLQIASGEYLDLAAYDGRISNREDEENPGLVRSFNMQRVRELKSRLRDTPHGQGRRVVLLMGLSLNREEAANALLKVLEDPSPTTVFVLLAPQREQLLPTLVSRSFCLTLPWPDSRTRDAALALWEETLAAFLCDGHGFLDKVSTRGAMYPALAGRLLLACQKSLSRVLADEAESPLDISLAALDARGRAVCCRWLAEAQDMLQYGVTPARVLETLAARIFVLRRDVTGKALQNH
ncbi:DNA polymerase III subunit delta' [uncultured Desulfovibrio sp.]|uniref:DNA polymerase III subunit delta' n=1 Tax=uncultured Desulfovibrio sp. TaxID=167968 RepID=UPI0003A5F802|nr:DNA polymerase III subunit delta' [uncultured Desulfovibrio sp.]